MGIPGDRIKRVETYQRSLSPIDHVVSPTPITVSHSDVCDTPLSKYSPQIPHRLSSLVAVLLIGL